MPFETPELMIDRYLEGMVRVGRVTQVKTQKNIMATVTYPDRSFQSPYLLVMQRNTIGMQDYYVPVAGESVWVLMQGRSLNRGIILGSAYTGTNPPPWNVATMRGMMFSDKSFIVYDTSGGGNYQINLKGKANITAVSNINITSSANVNINGVTIDSAGNVIIPGTLRVKGTSQFDGYANFPGGHGPPD